MKILDENSFKVFLKKIPYQQEKKKQYLHLLNILSKMKNTFQRPHLEILKKRITEPQRFIQVLFGPRQVGKTTLAFQLLDDVVYPYHFADADAVPAGAIPWLEQQWNQARLQQQQQGSEFLLVIDEIQKIGNWSETVKNFGMKTPGKIRPSNYCSWVRLVCFYNKA